MNDEIKKRTQETAKKLWTGGIKLDPPYLTWKEFDKDLANDLSMFITGNLYSRTVLTLPERQMAACAMLAALGASDELRLHVNAALNVGCDPKSSPKFLPARPLRRHAAGQQSPRSIQGSAQRAAANGNKFKETANG